MILVKIVAKTNTTCYEEGEEGPLAELERYDCVPGSSVLVVDLISPLQSLVVSEHLLQLMMKLILGSLQYLGS